MKRDTFILAAAVALTCCVSNVAADNRSDQERAAQRASLASPENRAEEIREAAKVYREMIRNARGTVPAAVLNDARCIAIVPGAMTAALGVGGMHGHGVGFCKTATNEKTDDTTARAQWTGPVFLEVSTGSIGAQAGVRSADLVYFISREDAKRAMLEDGLKFGGEVSAVAGSYDKTFTIPRNGVAVYSNAEGLFAGASISEGRLSRDDDRGKEFYGTSYDRANIFRDNSLKMDPAVKDLVAMLPGAQQ